MKGVIWIHILSDIVRNVFRYAPFALRSLIGRVRTDESCGTRYGDVSWREAPPSMGQLRIERYLAGAPLDNVAILHVGVGSSSIAQRFHEKCRQIDGITVMADEVAHAQSLGFANYCVFEIGSPHNPPAGSIEE